MDTHDGWTKRRLGLPNRLDLPTPCTTLGARYVVHVWCKACRQAQHELELYVA